jgi:DNA-binding response OmpR family regulator
MVKRVLVVEDDTDIREMYRIMFQMAGFETIQAMNGEEAIERLKEQAPDALILDISMPKKSGLQVIEYVREDMGRDDLPIIVATAYPYLAEATITAGATHTLMKPVSMQKLVDLVRASVISHDRPSGATKRF